MRLAQQFYAAAYQNWCDTHEVLIGLSVCHPHIP